MKSHPVFARFYGVLERAMGETERPYREETAGAATGRVLEVGAGTGGNLAFYPPEATVVAAEPEPTMVRQLVRRAREDRPGTVVVRARAEALPFPDAAFDTVVASLVLCSVEDPERAVAEIRRVLRPGGSLRFYEHVLAPAGTSLERQQRLLAPAWSVFAGGCRPNRDTVRTLSEAGFRVRWRPFRMPNAWLAGPHVVGEAVASDGRGGEG